MEHQCSNYRDHHSGEFSGNYPCAICALEKRVEELKARIEKLEKYPATIEMIPLSQPNAELLREAVKKMTPEPKLYSGFTADEWNMMLKDGPLLCNADIGQIWIDSFDVDMIDEFSSGGGNQNRRFKSVKLIEQPNWRLSHMTDECPVPGRVRVEVAYNDKDDNEDDASGNVSDFIWKRRGHHSDICAYRILGMGETL